MARDLHLYDVSDGAKLLSGNLAGLYYRGNKILKRIKFYGYEDRLTMSLRCSVRVELDSGEQVTIRCTDSELPTSITPRSYINHINLQKLEDNHHER